MIAKRTTRNVALVATLVGTIPLFVFGLYRTTTSDLTPMLWPEPDGGTSCWPDLDWDTVLPLLDDSRVRALEDSVASVEKGRLPDSHEALPAEISATMRSSLDTYERVLRRGELGGLPIDREESPLRTDLAAFGALPSLHALLLHDVAQQAALEPARGMERLASVLDATFDAASGCSDPRMSLAWTLNLRRTLDLAGILCASPQARTDAFEEAREELVSWAADRHMAYAEGLDSMFIRDYHRIRKLLEELVRRSQWLGLFTWLPYNAHSVSLAVDRCYLERYAFGVGRLWEAPSRPQRMPPIAELHGRTLSLSEALCVNSTQAWRAVVTLDSLAPQISLRLTLLRECAAR